MLKKCYIKLPCTWRVVYHFLCTELYIIICRWGAAHMYELLFYKITSYNLGQWGHVINICNGSHFRVACCVLITTIKCPLWLTYVDCRVRGKCYILVPWGSVKRSSRLTIAPNNCSNICLFYCCQQLNKRTLE